MSLSIERMTNGLTPEHDLVFAQQPDDPEMRESTSVWIFEENGAFGFPRIGIEAEASNWDNRLYTVNIALGGGRILIDSGRGSAPSPLGASGQPTVLGAGPLRFECIDPFRRWRMRYDGNPAAGLVRDQIAGDFDRDNCTTLQLEIEMDMVTPAWVQDNSPARVAAMSPADRADAESMGVGWRLEHLFRGIGRMVVDGESREFNLLGSRIKRQSVRPLGGFRGHCWQSALFPDGSAFGYIAYPPGEQGERPYNEGYVYRNGTMYPARATRIPWLRHIVEDGDDASLVLEYELGTMEVQGRTALSTFKVNNPDMAALGAPGFSLQQSGAEYTWDGQRSYGMIERSATGKQMAAQ